MKASDISPGHLSAISDIERACSTLSLLGCLFVIITFSASKAFHKPINRLVFYASFGNLMANVGTLMARSYVDDPNGGPCQLQAFLIQMFMPADALWTLAMAVNVYLTFYFKFDAQRLRKMELPYFLACYGIPFAAAFTFIWVNDPVKGRYYGNATLWCWVSPKWDVWRIAAFYGPVWVVIVITFFIYLRAGREIYNKRRQLHNFSQPAPYPLPLLADPFTSLKTTEVYVTSEVVTVTTSEPAGVVLGPGEFNSGTTQGQTAPLGLSGSRRASVPSPNNGPAAYSVTISSASAQPRRGSTGSAEDSVDEKPPQKAYRPGSPPPPPPPAKDGDDGLDSPISRTSSSSRRDSLSASNQPSPHHKSSSTSASTKGASKNGPPAPGPLRRRAALEASSAAWSYTKCAILFFTAMLVTWIPSSANRVYSIVHPGEMDIALGFASAFVLPLQGFWNALIYIVTSWSACRELWAQCFGGGLGEVTELVELHRRGSGGAEGAGAGGRVGVGAGASEVVEANVARRASSAGRRGSPLREKEAAMVVEREKEWGRMVGESESTTRLAGRRSSGDGPGQV